MSKSKYHSDDKVEIVIHTDDYGNKNKKMVKRTSVCYGAVTKETPHGTAVITSSAVYKKDNKEGTLVRIDRKPKLGKAGRKAEKRAKQLERACKL